MMANIQISCVGMHLVRTQKFSEKGKAPPPLIEIESQGCFLWTVNLLCD
jgi:hypothetical protein